MRSFFPEGENGVVEAHRFGPGVHVPAHRRRARLQRHHAAHGRAYDVFGNGKTAFKVSISKYLQAAYNGDVYTINNPAVTLVQTTSRG